MEEGKKVEKGVKCIAQCHLKKVNVMHKNTL